MRALAPPLPPGQGEDTGEWLMLASQDPARTLQKAADAFGTAPPGSDTQGIGDWFKKAVSGAKDGLRVLSYTVMKARAGDIGQKGLGPLLQALHAASPQVRVHLVGHSFGARLVSFALSGIDSPADSPVASLVLVQGAFSHWSFAGKENNPFGESGALEGYQNRVHGPLVSTFSVYDWAVGVWYPKASFLAGQSVEAAEQVSRWGGMGADGFQAVPQLVKVSMQAGGGTDYGFAPGGFYGVNAAAVINNVQGQPFAGAHSDIRKAPVAQLIAAAAAAHS